MRDDNNEKQFGKLAKAYADRENIGLEKEFAEIEKDKRLFMIPESGLSGKIRNKKFKDKYANFRYAMIPLAASAVILFFVFGSYRAGMGGSGSAPTASSASAPSTAAPAAPAPTPAPSASAPSAAAPAPAPAKPAPSTPPASAPSPSTPSAPAAPSTRPPLAPSTSTPPSYAQAISLVALRDTVSRVSDRLPDGYMVTDVDYDNLIAVMEIVNERENYIILTVEEYSGFDTKGFSEIIVNGSPVYGLVTNDYSVLKYNIDNTLYTLSSWYDYHDLIEISKNII